jgi:hypothetical protein
MSFWISFAFSLFLLLFFHVSFLLQCYRSTFFLVVSFFDVIFSLFLFSIEYRIIIMGIKAVQSKLARARRGISQGKRRRKERSTKKNRRLTATRNEEKSDTTGIDRERREKNVRLKRRTFADPESTCETS